MADKDLGVLVDLKLSMSHRGSAVFLKSKQDTQVQIYE